MKMNRWLAAVLDAAEDDTLVLPWSRKPGRKARKAAARARAEAD